MNLTRFFRDDFGSDFAVRERYSFKDKLSGYLTLTRPLLLILTPLNAASAAVLSIRGLPSWETCLEGFFTGALAAAGVNTFNRYTDRERDKALWPQRGIPSGRVPAKNALALSLLWYAASLALCWFFFNPTAFYILLAAEVLGSAYSAFLRDKIGYMSLPLMEGLIFLCGWACLAPGTVFTTALPWYLYFLGVIWQSAHIIAHYALNIRYDQNAKADIATPLIISKPKAPAAARLTLLFGSITFIMSIAILFVTRLSYLYFIPVALYGIYTLYRCGLFVKDPLDKPKTQNVWSALSTFRLVISAAMILSVMVYH